MLQLAVSWEVRFTDMLQGLVSGALLVDPALQVGVGARGCVWEGRGGTQAGNHAVAALAFGISKHGNSYLRRPR